MEKVGWQANEATVREIRRAKGKLDNFIETFQETFLPI